MYALPRHPRPTSSPPFCKFQVNCIFLMSKIKISCNPQTYPAPLATKYTYTNQPTSINYNQSQLNLQSFRLIHILQIVLLALRRTLQYRRVNQKGAQWQSERGQGGRGGETYFGISSGEFEERSDGRNCKDHGSRQKNGRWQINGIRLEFLLAFSLHLGGSRRSSSNG